MTIRQAAAIASVPPSTIANWRAGASPDDHIALRRLADHFDVTLGFLLTGEPENLSRISTHQIVRNGKIIFEGLARISIQEIVLGATPPLPARGRKPR